MTAYMLMPGACHGAWCFDDLAENLRAQGHRVLAVTLIKQDTSWTTHVLDGAHNLMRDNPDDLLTILLDAA